MGERVRVLAPAKVNLHLEVFPPREDGYHPIFSLFQSIDLYDELEICSLKELDTCLFEGNCSIPWEDNIIEKAVSCFRKATGIQVGLRIRLQKVIPVGSGLGGGSSDAAATLLALNALFGCPLSEVEIAELGGTIGSDVPFFCKGYTALVSGRGEIVEPFYGRTGYWILLVVPLFSISTRNAYHWIDEANGWTYPDASLRDRDIKNIFQGPVQNWCFSNAFTPVIEKRYPQYSQILRTLHALGAQYCSLSGSGSSYFGIFNSEAAGREAEEALRLQYPQAKLTIPLDRKPIPILE